MFRNQEVFALTFFHTSLSSSDPFGKIVGCSTYIRFPAYQMSYLTTRRRASFTSFVFFLCSVYVYLRKLTRWYRLSTTR